MQKKVLMLLNDLVMNDDRIFGNDATGDKFFVRRFFTHRDDVLNQLISNVV